MSWEIAALVIRSARRIYMRWGPRHLPVPQELEFHERKDGMPDRRFKKQDAEFWAWASEADKP